MPLPLFFAWTGALGKRGELDGLPQLCAVSKKLEKTIIKTIEDGYMTGDLAAICNPSAKKILDSTQFIDTLAQRLKSIF